MLFVCDHYRFYELKDKIKSSAYLAASIIQQVNNTKTDKQLTIKDLARITYASYLNFFHTNTMFNPWPFGIYFSMDYHFVKRINKDSYQYQLRYDTSGTGNSPNNTNMAIENMRTISLSLVKKLHPDLVCDKDGDEKLLLECCYKIMTNFSKTKLGFKILEPISTPPRHGPDSYWGGGVLFLYDLVIMPKPGLFPAKK